MKTLRTAPIALLGLVLALALVGSSCSSANPVALQVGEWQLSSSDFQSQLTDWYDASQEAGGQSAVQGLRGTTEGTWSTEYTSFLLNVQALSQVAQQTAAERGLEVTDADLADARSQVEGEFVGSSGASYFDSLPTDYTDALVHGIAAQNLVARDLVAQSTSDEALRNLFDSSGDQFAGDQLCVSHILVFAGQPDGQTTPSDADYAAALAKVEQIEQGLTAANFATVAQSSSEDTGSASAGGDLGCNPRGNLPADFEAIAWSLPIGQVSGPEKTIYGYHLILVRSRGPVSFEQVKSQLAAQVQNSASSLLAAEYARVADEIGVTVDGRFGRWDATAAQVTAPAGPQQPSTTTAGLTSPLGTGSSSQ